MRIAAAVALLTFSAGVAAAQTAPSNVVVEYTSIERTSLRKSRAGDPLPPFTSASGNIAWQKKPFRAGGQATFLPFEASLPAVQVTITQVKLLPEGNQCTGEKPLWQMTGAAIRNPAILGARPLRAPSGAVAPIWAMMVYPASSRARIVPPGSFTAADIPRGFAVANILAGVDLTGNGRPEAVLLSYCLDPNGRPDIARGRNCLEKIQAVHLKEASGWKEHRLYEPC